MIQSLEAATSAVSDFCGSVTGFDDPNFRRRITSLTRDARWLLAICLDCEFLHIAPVSLPHTVLWYDPARPFQEDMLTQQSAAITGFDRCTRAVERLKSVLEAWKTVSDVIQEERHRASARWRTIPTILRWGQDPLERVHDNAIAVGERIEAMCNSVRLLQDLWRRHRSRFTTTADQTHAGWSHSDLSPPDSVVAMWKETDNAMLMFTSRRRYAREALAREYPPIPEPGLGKWIRMLYRAESDVYVKVTLGCVRRLSGLQSFGASHRLR